MARGHRRRRVRVQHRLRRAPILRHRARVRPSHQLRHLRRARQEAHRVGPRHRRRQGHDGGARTGRHGRVHPIRRTHRVGVDGQSHQDLRSREIVRMRRDSHRTRIVRPGARRPPRHIGRRLPLRKRGRNHPRVEERGGRRRRLRQTRRHRPRPRRQRTGGPRALRVARYDRQGVDRGGAPSSPTSAGTARWSTPSHRACAGARSSPEAKTTPLACGSSRGCASRRYRTRGASGPSLFYQTRMP